MKYGETIITTRISTSHRLSLSMRLMAVNVIGNQ